MDLYKCKHCDEVYDKVFEGSVCEEPGCACEDLDLLKPQTADWKNEKHVPMIEKADNGHTKVTVGSTLHPMTDEHWITMVEIWDGDLMMRKMLHPGDNPSVVFPIVYKDGLKAREYCNIHGLWATE